MLPVSQDCSFFVAPTNFSVVYVYIYHRLCKQVYNEMINNNDTFWDYDTLNLGIIRDVTPDVSCFECQSQASLNSMFGTNTKKKMMLEVQTKIVLLE